jgi:hypothetical protein
MLMLSPLPCWEHLSAEAYRARNAELIGQIEADAAAKRETTGIEPLGRERILRQHPHSRPNQTKKSPAPLFHAFTKRARRELYEAYAWFVAAFREAAEKLERATAMRDSPPGAFRPICRS